MEAQFTLKQLTRIPNTLTPRRLQWWDETGVLKANRLTGSGGGRGYMRVYSKRAATLALTIAALRERHVHLDVIRRQRAYLRSRIDSSHYLAILGSHSKVTLQFVDEEEIMPLARLKPMRLIDLAEIRDSVRDIR